ncbi:MAG: hypothetical protein M3348_14355 [Acidobacteriota bacterium]|nr:hypothetical protein [Acidobacteriota bacterium]
MAFRYYDSINLKTRAPANTQKFQSLNGLSLHQPIACHNSDIAVLTKVSIP